MHRDQDPCIPLLPKLRIILYFNKLLSVFAIQTMIHIFAKNLFMKNQFAVILALLTISTAILSCGGEQKPSELENDGTAVVTDTTPIDEVATFRFSYTIANLPSPMTIFDELTKSNLPVETSYLNPSGNVKKYNTTQQMAFNYGIYGVDLAYLVINERNTDIYSYYTASKTLAEGL